jgi:hypothetical protein
MDKERSQTVNAIIKVDDACNLFDEDIYCVPLPSFLFTTTLL